MPDFNIVEGRRFDGEFSLDPDPNHAPTTAEQAYLDALHRVMDSMAQDHDADPTGDDEGSVALRQARVARRNRALQELQAEAAEFIAGHLIPEIAADNAFVIRGRYVADIERLTGSFFLVEPVIDRGQVQDVIIYVSEELPLTRDPGAPAKQALYVALVNARTVVKTVARRIEDRADRSWPRRGSRENAQANARRLRDEYMRKLVEIGKLGLQNPHVELANLALNGFRADFVAQEAGRIKNTYLRSLGFTAGIAVFAFLAIYTLVYVFTDFAHAGFWSEYWPFLLAGAGASIGTWLSFSIRRVTLGFDDLGILEEDLLDPGIRIVFVIALTMVVCLLFRTGALNLEIGNLKTSGLADNNANLPLGAISLLIGIFCGIAERALATAISGRAAAFVRSVGS